MPRFFIGTIPDTVIVIPTLVFQLGRCQRSGKVAGVSLLLSWLNVEMGFELDLFT